MKEQALENTRTGFFKNHADTIAIIGVNLALAAIMMSMWISNTHRIDSCNERIDSSLSRIDGMYELLMNNAGLSLPRNKIQFDHSKGFQPYHDVVPQATDWMIQDTRQGE